MQILVDRQLKGLVQQGKVIRYGKADTTSPTTIDLHVGGSAKIEAPFQWDFGSCFMHRSRLSKPQFIELDLALTSADYVFALAPGQYIVLQSEELISLPLNLRLQFFLKSEPARLGQVHGAATLVHPGWVNHLAIEIFNGSQYPFPFYRGMAVGAIELTELSVLPDKPYSGRFGQTVS